MGRHYVPVMEPDLGASYASARRRITSFLADADQETSGLPVPATPGWTVHDVVAHLRGIVEDALRGNMDGVTSEPWTAAQVERGRDVALRQLLDDWNSEAPLVEAALSSPAPSPNATAAVIDVHTHEADLRGALGLPPAMPDEYGRLMFAALAGGLIARAAEAGLAPVRVCTSEGDELGPADASVTLRADRHELHRGALGRRSAEQMAAWFQGCEDPRAYVSALVVFGPRPAALVD